MHEGLTRPSKFYFFKISPSLFLLSAPTLPLHILDVFAYKIKYSEKIWCNSNTHLRNMEVRVRGSRIDQNCTFSLKTNLCDRMTHASLITALPYHTPPCMRDSRVAPWSRGHSLPYHSLPYHSLTYLPYPSIPYHA